MKCVVGLVGACALLIIGSGIARADFVNGNFGTGDLTGWTVFTTANGTNGNDPNTGAALPAVVSYNTTGSGATNSAHFNVGNTTLNGAEEGGGIAQSLTLGAGSYTITGAFASEDDPDGQVNSSAGVFSILVDQKVVQSFDLGGFGSAHQVYRGTWDATVSLGAGSHQFSFEITRPFGSNGSATPQEYLTNLQLSSGTVPEPSSLTLLGIGIAGAIGIGWKRRRRA